MLISFVIPHNGRIDMLRQTLQSINAQDFDLAAFQVIVVTQNPEGTLDGFFPEGGFSLSVIYAPPDVTISRLRNLGVEQSDSDYLAFLDADIALSPDWLKVMLKLLEEAVEPRRVISSAVQVEGENAPALEVIRTELSNAKVDCNVEFLPGRNLFIRRRDFTAIGGFPEHLITCEDYFFTDQAAKLGALYYSADANYVHLGEDKDFWQMYKKEIWRGQSNLLSIRGRTIPLSEYPSFLVPLWFCFFLVLAVVLLFVAPVSLVFVAAALGILPLLIYPARLYWLSKGHVRWGNAVKFYALYFPARAYGTLVGAFKAIDLKSS